MDEGISQRDMMRRLHRDHNRDEARTIEAYAKAELNGKVKRRSNNWNLSPKQYAQALLRDGQRKGWL